MKRACFFPILRIRTKGIALLFFLLCALHSDAGELLLWKVVRDGMPGTLYLAGSIHMGKKEMYPLDAAYDQALASSSEIVMETADQNTGKLMMFMLKNGFYKRNQEKGETLSKRLGEEDFQKLSALCAEYMSPAETAHLNLMKLWVVFATLDIAPLRKAQYSEKYGLEEVFRAHAGTRRLISLEDGISQLQLMIGPDVEKELAAALHRLDPGEYRREAEEEAQNAWKMDETRILRNMDKMKNELPILHRKLLLDRNRDMAGKLYDFMKEKKTCFVLVGAAHFLGDGSIRSLLTEKGCTVTPVPAAGKKGLIAPPPPSKKK